jgi:hypothetical protein
MTRSRKVPADSGAPARPDTLNAGDGGTGGPAVELNSIRPGRWTQTTVVATWRRSTTDPSDELVRL